MSQILFFEENSYYAPNGSFLGPKSSLLNLSLNLSFRFYKIVLDNMHQKVVQREFWILKENSYHAQKWGKYVIFGLKINI